MPNEDKPTAAPGPPAVLKPAIAAATRIGWDPKSTSPPDPTDPEAGWRRRGRSLSAKLIGLIFAAMVVIFALLGYANIRLHRHHLEAATLASAERVSDVIKRSTTYYMLRNDREALYQDITTIATEPGIVRIRIFDQEGKIGLLQ